MTLSWNSHGSKLDGLMKPVPRDLETHYRTSSALARLAVGGGDRTCSVCPNLFTVTELCVVVNIRIRLAVYYHGVLLIVIIG